MTTSMDGWAGLGTFLQDQLEKIPPAGTPPIAYETSGIVSLSLAAAAAVAERKHKAAIESAIAGWSETGQWPELDEAAREWLIARIDAALGFVLLFCVAGLHPETSLVPWPVGLSCRDVAVWLLTDWWERHGRLAAVDSWIVAAHDGGRER